MANGKGLRIHFEVTRGLELFLIALMLGSMMALFQMASIYRTEGISWNPHLLGGVTFSGLATLWVTVIIFHICLITIIARSVIVEGRNQTSNSIDYAVGGVGILSLYLILTAILSGLHTGSPTIEFLWNIKSLTLLQLGFIFNFAVALYFGFTN